MKNKKIYNLFVYGTLRKDSGNELFSLLDKNASFIGKCSVNAKLYDLGEYPGAIPAKRAKIIGELYALDEKRYQNILKKLDEYEGFDTKNKENSEYIRDLTEVKLENKQEIPAWIYWYQFPVQEKKRIKTGDYFNS